MDKVGVEAVGGIMTLPPECAGMPSAWGVYVTVDDMDATARQVEALGGKLLRPPEDNPEIGRFCVLQDPRGLRCAPFPIGSPGTPGHEPAMRGEVVVQFWLKPGEAAVMLEVGEERKMERIPEQLKSFLRGSD